MFFTSANRATHRGLFFLKASHPNRWSLLGIDALKKRYREMGYEKNYWPWLAVGASALTALLCTQNANDLSSLNLRFLSHNHTRRHYAKPSFVSCFSTTPFKTASKAASDKGFNVVMPDTLTCMDPLWRSNENRPFDRKDNETVIFSGNSNLPLASSIANCLGTTLGKIKVGRFADGEVHLQFKESIRGKDVYIVQPTSTPVNEHLVELLLMVSTARRSSAKKITAVIPYYGYARQDRKLHSRVPISAADVARMIESAGADRVISVDLHCGQIQGFFGPRVPVDNLEAQIIAADYFLNLKLQKPVVVSPDAGGVYRARKFQQTLQSHGIKDVGLAIIVKQRLKANLVERMDLVGNVNGCDVVIVDDMIDTAGTLCEAAKRLKGRGAKRVFAFATHGLFSNPALERINASSIEKIIVCDTIKPRPEILKCERIHYLSMAPLLADAIRRIHQKESLQQLF